MNIPRKPYPNQEIQKKATRVFLALHDFKEPASINIYPHCVHVTFLDNTWIEISSTILAKIGDMLEKEPKLLELFNLKE